MTKVVVINYGLGNVKSVVRGIENSGATAVLTDDPDELRNAERVVLPGVGAFENGMNELRRRKLDIALREYVRTERPLLGICLGMQMLFEESEEHGRHKGLGLIPGQVRLIPKDNNGSTIRKIPHIGWSRLFFPDGSESRNGTVLDSVNEGDYVYFVHSYMACPDDEKHTLAQCKYGDLAITAFVKNKNISGCQFHPEKSGVVGLKLLSAFLSL